MKKDSKENTLVIRVPVKGNKILEKVLDKVNSDVELKTLWQITNTNALERWYLSDHGPVHFQIVSNIALRLSRILTRNKIELSISKDFGLSEDYGELVVFLGSLFHDLGMSIERDGHEEFSLFLANGILHRILEFIPAKERTIVISETLHAIISHRKGGKPVTIEAGIIRVADALEMGEGRSRIPYQKGDFNIYSISDSAIDGIEIKEGKEKPIEVVINMNNSAGIFQVDELLKNKLKGSGIEKYVGIKVYIRGNVEKSLMKTYEIK